MLTVKTDRQHECVGPELVLGLRWAQTSFVPDIFKDFEMFLA